MCSIWSYIQSWHAEQWEAAASWASVLVVGILAFLTWQYLIAARKQAEETTKQVEESRKQTDFLQQQVRLMNEAHDLQLLAYSAGRKQAASKAIEEVARIKELLRKFTAHMDTLLPVVQWESLKSEEWSDIQVYYSVFLELSNSLLELSNNLNELDKFGREQAARKSRPVIFNYGSDVRTWVSQSLEILEILSSRYSLLNTPEPDEGEQPK
jgi:hypothetical protein